ncbi:MAG: glycosyltransferase family 92 protein [Spirochaetaceae bacterium]|nr:glycosyltransferase family 92 protein [Spirochaetaceae bacterium]
MIPFFIKKIFWKIIPQKAGIKVREAFYFCISAYLTKKYNPSTSFKHYLSIAAIAKNEAPYIREWIEYHLIVGVDKFYIYDNESEDGLKKILQPYIESGIVEYKYIRGKSKQIYAYNKTLTRVRNKTYWLALIDIDEFIVPVSEKTIPDFLKGFEDFPAVHINWLVYGSSGRKTKTNGLVIERFKDHSETDFYQNRFTKAIVNPRKTIIINVHGSTYIHGALGVKSDQTAEQNISVSASIHYDKIRINHYYGKSYEEFLNKKNRGRGTNVTIRYIDDNFYALDRNEVKNDPIMDKYIPLIYENLKKRAIR